MLNNPDSQDIALAIDIGGTKAAFSVINSAGELLFPVEKHFVPFDSEGKAHPDRLLEMIAPYVQRARQYGGKLNGIGLSLCGNIDAQTGMAVLVSNLHWRYLPFGQMVKEAFNLPVFAATDVRMAALGEAAWGAARGVRDFAWATVGTGYGGYLFLDGKLYDGSHGFAGNFGHTTLDEVNGYPCGCGRNGCFETFVAGPGITRAGQKAAETGESPYLKLIAAERPVSSYDVFKGEANGDPACVQIIKDVIRLISINLGGMVNILDLQLIIMGGGVTHAAPDFVSRINTRIRDFLMTEEAARDLRVINETFENSSLIGAAADVFFRQNILSF
ncbi:MAG: ROK family protein [Anaerolineae bacterium]|nr:ROK family protein [Anaerolineae bacterium]